MNQFMSTTINPKDIVIQLKRFLEPNNSSEIRLNANGGNSILLVCSPELEFEFVTYLNNLLPKETFVIIDINEILISFVENHQSDITEMFDLLKGAVHQIFKAPIGENSPDLFKYLLLAIEQSFISNKIPVLINNGALYGSGIDNLHLMENELVMKSKLPLIILYPATKEGDHLLFLNSRPASKYRCMIINDKI
jgi:hypothetical protein